MEKTVVKNGKKHKYHTKIDEQIEKISGQMSKDVVGKLVQVMEKTLSKLATFDEGSMMGSMLGFVNKKINVTGSGTDLGKSYILFIRSNLDTLSKRITDDCWILIVTERWYHGQMGMLATWLTNRMDKALHPYQCTCLSHIVKKMYNEYELHGMTDEKIRTAHFTQVEQRMATEEATCALQNAENSEHKGGKGGEGSDSDSEGGGGKNGDSDDERRRRQVENRRKAGKVKAGQDDDDGPKMQRQQSKAGGPPNKPGGPGGPPNKPGGPQNKPGGPPNKPGGPQRQQSKTGGPPNKPGGPGGPPNKAGGPPNKPGGPPNKGRPPPKKMDSDSSDTDDEPAPAKGKAPPKGKPPPKGKAPPKGKPGPPNGASGDYDEDGGGGAAKMANALQDGGVDKAAMAAAQASAQAGKMLGKGIGGALGKGFGSFF
jgi:hypothetical protein